MANQTDVKALVERVTHLPSGMTDRAAGRLVYILGRERDSEHKEVCRRDDTILDLEKEIIRLRSALATITRCNPSFHGDVIPDPSWEQQVASEALKGQEATDD